MLVTDYFKQAVKQLSTVAIVLVLGGCASGVNMLPSLTETTVLSNQQGVVVAKVINASAYPLPFNQLTIAPKNLNESDKIKPERLQAIDTPLTKSTVFAAPVNAGSYSLFSLRTFYTRGDYWFSRFAPADAKFGTFEVKPGQVTNLGTIIYYPKPDKDQYLHTLVRVDESDAGKTLKDYFPYYQYQPEQILPWNKDERDEERQNYFISIAQNPITYNEKYLAPDNSIYFVGKLGVIVKRTADGEWLIDAVDTNSDLTSIAQNQAGDTIVAGNEGRVFIKRTDDEQWQDVSVTTNHDIERVVIQDNGDLDIIARKETKLIVYRTNINQPNWQIIASYSTVGGWRDADGNKQVVVSKDTKKTTNKKPKARRIVNATIEQVNDQHFIAIVTQSLNSNYVFAEGDKVTFTYDPNTWQARLADDEQPISAALNAGATKLGIKYAGFWSWDGRPDYFRLDNNSQEWIEIITHVKSCKQGTELKGNNCTGGDKPAKASKKTFNFTSVPWFYSDLEAVAIVSFSDFNFWTGQSKRETKFVTTSDGGKNWQITDYELPNKYCTDLIAEAKDYMLLSCKGVSSDFYESYDQGQTWQHVREQESF